MTPLGEDGAAYSDVLAGVRALARWAGDDPDRPGLTDTPARVAKAFAELTAGLKEDPARILARTFGDIPGDDVIVLRHVHFTSLCEHHFLPFVGEATVGYLPSPEGGVVGISKLARLVLCYARRLQVQERLTAQVTAAVMEHLKARGAGCIVTAHHACMGCRGVRQHGAVMVTSSMLGVFRDEPAARNEFLTLARG